MSQITWHILGAGAIGCLWAANLQSAQPVTLLVRPDGAATHPLLDGLQLELGSNTQKSSPRVESTAEASPIRRLLVTTKSYQCESAVAAIRQRLTPDAQVILLQNGMGCQQQAARLLAGIPVYAGTTTDGAFRRTPNTLVWAGRGETWFGPLNNLAKQQGSTPLEPLLSTQLQAGYDEAIENRLWRKLAINAAINGLTALHNCRNGALAENPAYRQEMATLCQEIAQLARTLNIPLSDQETSADQLLQTALRIARATAKNYSSMQQDVAYGRQTEIDFINGYISAQAKKVGVATPANDALVRKVRALRP